MGMAIVVIIGGAFVIYAYTLLFMSAMEAERDAGSKEERNRCIRIINECRAASPREHSQWLLELVVRIGDEGEGLDP